MTNGHIYAANKVHRLTDPNDAPAVIEGTKQNFCFINDEPVATDGDPVESHPPGGIHNNAETANGSSGTFINDVPVNGKTDEDTCGHVRAEAPHNTYVTT